MFGRNDSWMVCYDHIDRGVYFRECHVPAHVLVDIEPVAVEGHEIGMYDLKVEAQFFKLCQFFSSAIRTRALLSRN